jgi:cell division protein FtsB
MLYNVRRAMTVVPLIAAPLVMTACVSQSTYDALQQQNQQLQSQNQQLQAQNQQLQQQVAAGQAHVSRLQNAVAIPSTAICCFHRAAGRCRLVAKTLLPS